MFSWGAGSWAPSENNVAATIRDAARSYKVLVVEDDASIREALCDVLRLAGHEPSGAEHGKAGLDEVAKEVPDVILLDLRMPVMNGIEFLRAIAPKKLRSRIIVLTANPQDLPPGMNVPMLAKPYDVERLLRVIDGVEP
jgi:DNA-binding response OmpR family regulator